MIRAEKLSCQNEQYHKNCIWVNVAIQYPDTRYLMLKNRLIAEVRKTHIAYRITHYKFGVLTTIKFGHGANADVFVADNQEALRAFAVF